MLAAVPGVREARVNALTGSVLVFPEKAAAGAFPSSCGLSCPGGPQTIWWWRVPARPSLWMELSFPARRW